MQSQRRQRLNALGDHSQFPRQVGVVAYASEHALLNDVAGPLLQPVDEAFQRQITKCFGDGQRIKIRGCDGPQQIIAAGEFIALDHGQRQQRRSRGLGQRYSRLLDALFGQPRQRHLGLRGMQTQLAAAADDGTHQTMRSVADQDEMGLRRRFFEVFQ